MKLSKRTAAIVLALVAVAGVVGGREKPAAEERPQSRPAQAANGIGAVPDIDLARLARVQASAPRNDPFAAVSFAPPAPAQASARAQAPTAPPLPFAYVGRITQDGKTETFVMRGEELISVAPGRSIDGDYRVDAVSASSIAFTYLPLKTRQSLDLEVGG